MAVGGGQGIAVGASGIVLHIAADPTPRVPIPDTSLRVEVVVVPGFATTLNAVHLECIDNNRWPDCLAVAVGDHGAILEGVGRGRCDEGHPATEGCVWSWQTVPSPVAGTLRSVWRDAEGIVASDDGGTRVRRDASGAWRVAEQVPGTWREIEGPVRTVRRKFGATRSSTAVERVAFGSRAFLNHEATWVLMMVDAPVREASLPSLQHGELAFFLLADGTVDVATTR